MIRDNIKRFLSNADSNPFALARKANLNEGTVRSILKGQSDDPGVRKIYALAKALDVTIEDLIGESPLGRGVARAWTPNQMEVRYRTGGGIWIESFDGMDTPIDTVEGELLLSYRFAEQWYERLEGDSMNKMFPDGCLLHVVSAGDLGYQPRPRDVVIVRRIRNGGQSIERSVKQVAFSPNGDVELWPRSTNPRWQAPILLNDTPDDDTVTVQIVGLVVRGIIEAPGH